MAALQTATRRLKQLHIQEKDDPSGKRQRELAPVLSAAAAAGVEVVQTSKMVMNEMAENRPHQGMILHCQQKQFTPLQALPEVLSPPAAQQQAPGDPPAAPAARPPCWVALDEVGSAQSEREREREGYLPCALLALPRQRAVLPHCRLLLCTIASGNC